MRRIPASGAENPDHVGIFHIAIDFLCRLLERHDQTSGDHNMIDNRKILFLSNEKRMGLRDITKQCIAGRMQWQKTAFISVATE